MKLLKYIFLLLLITIIGGSIYFATQDGTYDIKDSQVIDAPVEVVFDIVNDYKTWEQWGPWKKEDSTMIFNYPEKTIGVGASYTWDGAMSGGMTTTNIEKHVSIAQDLTLFTPAGERNPKVYWDFKEVEGGTKVTWGMKGEHTLMDKAYYTFSGMDFEAEMHNMHKTGLEGLAAMTNQVINTYQINPSVVTQYSGGYYLYASAATSMNKIDNTMSQLMNQVMEYTQTQSIPMGGAPFCMYNQMDPVGGSAIISAAIPVRERIIPESNEILSGFLPAVTTVKTTLKGNYTHLPEAYAKGQEFILQNGYQSHPTIKMFEVYLTDPERVVNPANWLTEIHMPVIEITQE